MKRGFARLSPTRRRKMAALGGQAAKASGRSHRWTSEEASAAGHKSADAKRKRLLAVLAEVAAEVSV